LSFWDTLCFETFLQPGYHSFDGAIVPNGRRILHETNGYDLLGPITVRGELVDSKCYLGVMNPGHGKVHRDCAARCIGGGIPLALVPENVGKEHSIFYVMAKDRQSQQQLRSQVGEVITMSGQEVRVGEQLFLLAR
jgi:hypothetical protein